MTQQEEQETGGGVGLLERLSDHIAGVVALAGLGVVRVDDNSRLTASGVVWPSAAAGSDAIVAATSHGVEDDENVFVEEPSSGERFAAIVVGRDAESDVAVLRVPGAGNRFTAATLAPATAVAVGQLALALGRPGESGLRATLGIVSARHDAVENGRGEYIVHTDATLYRGFSGGALVDARGQVIGLLNLAFGRSGGVALGADMVGNIADNLLANGRVRRGYLGIGTQRVEVTDTAPGQGQNGGGASSTRTALLVVHIHPGSPAERSGLIVGDVLTALGGEPLESVDELRASLRRMQPGSVAALTLLRGGSVAHLDATLGEEQ